MKKLILPALGKFKKAIKQHDEAIAMFNGQQISGKPEYSLAQKNLVRPLKQEKWHGKAGII